MSALRLSRIFTSTALATTAALGFAVFSSLAVADKAQAAGEVIVGLVTKTDTNPYFVKLRDSAKAHATGKGADLIAVYNTGKYRMNGWASIYGTLPIGNANDVVLDLARDIVPIVKEVPLIGGIYAHDPTRDHTSAIATAKQAGFSGIINVPTIGRIDGTYRSDLESVGISFQREVDLLARAIEFDDPITGQRRRFESRRTL